MSKKKRRLDGKLAVGIFVDGLYMRVACLLKRKDGIHIIDAQNVALAGPLESANDAQVQAEGLGLECLAGDNPDEEEAVFDNAVLDLTAEMEEQSATKVDSDGQLSLPEEKDKEPNDDLQFQFSVDEDDVQADKSDAMPIDLEFLLEKPSESPFTVEDIGDVPDDASFEMPETAPDSDDIAIDISELELEEGSSSEDIAIDETLNISSLDISDELKIDTLSKVKEQASSNDNASILMNLLDRYAVKNVELAISLPEPQIYYSYFDTDWGLKGRKLKSRIADELYKERPDSEAIRLDAINMFRLEDGNLMAIVREPDIGILNLLDAVRISAEKRLPKISVVESAEISLVNLIKANYNFEEDEITVITFVGNDFSRLIFMKGNNLYHISPIIGEGIDSFLVFGHSLKELGNTIHSRLLLEQDDLNLPTIDNLILAGDACRAEIKNMLKSWFTDDIRIEELQYSNFHLNTGNTAVLKNLSHVSVAIGAALRVLEPNEKGLYQVDLIPNKIKDSQKVFKLGPVGWALLCMIPVSTFYMTTRVSEMNARINMLSLDYQKQKAELVQLKEIQGYVEAASKKLSYYQNTFGVLDSMVVGTETWSHFLRMVAINVKRIGGIWLTEMSFSENNKANLKGYSLLRHKISPLAESIPGATLNQVQVQEIRGRQVYYFTIEADVPQK